MQNSSGGEMRVRCQGSFINHVDVFLIILTPIPLRGHLYQIMRSVYKMFIWLIPSPSTVHVVYEWPLNDVFNEVLRYCQNRQRNFSIVWHSKKQRVVIDSKVTNFLHSWVVIGAFNDLSSNFCAIRFSKIRLKFTGKLCYLSKK